MSFSPVRNVRISSLTPGAVVQLRLGKAAVKSADDVIITAKLLEHREDGQQSVVDFEETTPDGVSKTTIARFPGAPWRSGQQYVSLVGVDESTFTIQKPASPITTNAIADAIELVNKEAPDVFAAEQLVALLTEIKDGQRINTGVKALANQLAVKLVAELSSLPDAGAKPAE